MPYENTINTTFGHTIDEVRAANPLVSIPDGADYKDFVWYEATLPEYDPRTQVATEAAPQGRKQQWSVTARPEEPVAEALERALDDMRRERQPMLNAVVGIMTVAIADGDTATVAKAKEVRTALLNLTADPDFLSASNYHDMAVAAKRAYRRVAGLVASSPQFAAVFKETTGA